MYEIGEKEFRAVKRVLHSRHFFRYGGSEVFAFEKTWAGKIGANSAIAVTSGTAALICSLAAMGIGPGDEVIVPAYTFISTALAVTAVGAIPVYAEVDSSLTLSPSDLARKITRRTACVIPVHMQGMPCDMAEILRIASAKKLKVLEDCCQSAGGRFLGKRLGSLGDMGAFSFNQYKIISCGEGGAVVTSNPLFAERTFMLQDGSCSVWPQTGKMSQSFFCAGNYRFNEVNASILRCQVSRLDGILSVLRRNRREIQSGLRLWEDHSLVPSHDERGNCGVCFLVRSPSERKAKRMERVLGKFLKVHRPIDSGRHVYSAWDVVNARSGGHHPAWDCFRHPLNKETRSAYDSPLETTDDYLKRTVLCLTPYDIDDTGLDRLIGKINKALAKGRM